MEDNNENSIVTEYDGLVIRFRDSMRNKKISKATVRYANGEGYLSLLLSNDGISAEGVEKWVIPLGEHYSLKEEQNVKNLEKAS